MRTVIVILLLLLLIPASFGQEKPQPGLRKVIGGKAFPLVMCLREMTAGWRRLAPEMLPDPQVEEELSATMHGAGGSIGTLYYTRGETVCVDGQVMLITYQREIRVRPFTNDELLKTPAALHLLEPFTLDTPLPLSLLSVQSLGSLRAITSLDTPTELAGVPLLELAVYGAKMRSLEMASMSNLRQLDLAAQMYAQDNGECWPVIRSVNDIKMQLNVPENITKNPLSGAFYVFNKFMGGKSIGEYVNLDDMVLFYDPTPWPNGEHLAAFLDGHVAALTPAQWARLQQRLTHAQPQHINPPAGH